jgi:hypothetical protein
MRQFDHIFENALISLREDASAASVLPNPNTLISAFQSLTPEQQQGILKTLPQKDSNLTNDTPDHGFFSKWIELMHTKQTPEDKSPTTVGNQPQTTNPSSVSGNSGINTGSTGNTSSNTSGNTSSGAFV